MHLTLPYSFQCGREMLWLSPLVTLYIRAASSDVPNLSANQHNHECQVQIGHVRLMLPCGESQSVGSQEEAASPPGAASMERSNSAFASVDMDAGQQAPNMLVIVLAGFQATSRTTEARVSNYASPGKNKLAIVGLASACSQKFVGIVWRMTIQWTPGCVKRFEFIVWLGRASVQLHKTLGSNVVHKPAAL